MSLLDKWGVSREDTPAIPAIAATHGREPAEHGGNTGVMAAPGVAGGLRPVAIPGTAGPMPQGDDLQESDFRNRNRSQTICDSLNRINAGVQTSKTQKSQGSQESQGVNSSACSMPSSDFSRGAGIAGVAASQFPHIPVDILPASLKAAFQERAAIAEVEGGLDREAAERLAWDEVIAGPIGDTLQAWRAWMNFRIRAWMVRRCSRAEAMHSVWSEAESIWHCRYGAAPNPDRCAGCGEWMLDGPGMRFEDGAVVHFGNPDRFDCLILYGQEWRATASAGLIALGLRKPQS